MKNTQDRSQRRGRRKQAASSLSSTALTIRLMLVATNIGDVKPTQKDIPSVEFNSGYVSIISVYGYPDDNSLEKSLRRRLCRLPTFRERFI